MKQKVTVGMICAELVVIGRLAAAKEFAISRGKREMANMIAERRFVAPSGLAFNTARAQARAAAMRVPAA